VFKVGQLEDAEGLGDNLDFWKDPFLDEIHGVILVTGSSSPLIEKTLAEVLEIFHVGRDGTTIEPVYQVSGHTRPGDEDGHEQ